MRTLVATFPRTGATKRYIIRPGDEPVVGDQIITSFSDGATSSAMVATVISFDKEQKTSSRAILKPYLLLVPAKTLTALQKESDAIVASMKEQKEILQELESLLEKEDKFVRYRRLAETNPRARELLAQLVIV